MRTNYAQSYMPLAEKLAWKRCQITPKSVDIDDLKSAAYLGLTQAANHFNADHGVSFGAYAIKWINGAMTDYLRELQWGPRHSRVNMASLDAPTEEGCLNNTIADNDERIEVLDGIEENSKKIIIMYYVEGFTQKEIGSKMNVSESRICQLLSRSKHELQQQLQRMIA